MRKTVNFGSSGVIESHQGISGRSHPQLWVTGSKFGSSGVNFDHHGTLYIWDKFGPLGYNKCKNGYILVHRESG